MTKLLLIDGSSLAFRAFYGLNQLDRFKTKQGFHTNALYAFHTMLDAILKREEPTHILVAFDAGKTTFRTTLFSDYKGGRASMPTELAEQWPYFKIMLDALGIRHYELANYEADDIIGTLAYQMSKQNQSVVVVSGDRDMIQLADDYVRIDITQKGNEVKAFTPQVVLEEYGVTPKQLIDVKGLMGDTSDNYPGVRKVGEKTALKLIQEYKSIECVYDNLDKMKASKLKENLIADKEMAYLSKTLATIQHDAPITITLDDTLYLGKQTDKLRAFYQQMEFNQFLKQIDTEMGDKPLQKVHYTEVVHITKDMFSNQSALHIEHLHDNYHTATPICVAWHNEETIYVASWEDAIKSDAFTKWLISDDTKTVFDSKKTQVLLARYAKQIHSIDFDVLLAAYIVNVNDNSTDLANIVSGYGVSDVMLDEEVYGKGAKFSLPDKAAIYQHVAQKVSALAKVRALLEDELQQAELMDLYQNMELPLARVLAKMESTGIFVDDTTLLNMGKELKNRLIQLEKDIHTLAGEVFNIASPKQLGTILFEKLGLPASKKTKTGYSTAVDVLEKLAEVPIVQLILDYRQLAKLQSTYVEGLLKFIQDDHKIHTRFVQTLTQTGRLSSTDPNLQNIPIRMEEGRRIRKAFVPSEPDWVILSADYSQIELRVLAHIAKDKHMIEAFKEQEDIHTSTAMRVFGVRKEDVTSDMRRQAKAVNFGIVYGISDYGLAQNLNITRKKAQQFIDTYFEKYPNIQLYMQDIVKEAKEKGYVTTLFNRRRYLPDLSSSNFNIRSFAERTAMNTPIQGSAADIIKIAMIRLVDKMYAMQLTSRLLLQVHDELIFEVPQEEIHIMQTLVQETMEQAVSLSVPLKVDSQIGKTWYDAK